MKKILFSVFLLANFALGGLVQAQDIFQDASGNLNNVGERLGFSVIGQDADPYERFARIVNIGLGLIGIVATVYIIYAGFKWITANGNSEEVSKAKDTIKNAVIGLMVIFLAYVIVNFVVSRLIQAVA